MSGTAAQSPSPTRRVSATAATSAKAAKAAKAPKAAKGASGGQQAGPPRPTRKVADGMGALRDIQWMARRNAQPDVIEVRLGHKTWAPISDRNGVPYRVNVATWLLEDALRRYGFDACRPDGTANRVYGEDEITETASIYADGTAADFAPHPDDLAQVGPDDEARLQWACAVLHPVAHTYADGRATYATSMFNAATRLLRHAGFDLTSTEAAGRSVWVRDHMPGCDGLTREEAAEREAVRAEALRASR